MTCLTAPGWRLMVVVVSACGQRYVEYDFVLLVFVVSGQQPVIDGWVGFVGIVVISWLRVVDFSFGLLLVDVLLLWLYCSHGSAGTSPVSLFLFKFSSLSFVRSASSVGIEPVSAFLLKSR